MQDPKGDRTSGNLEDSKADAKVEEKGNT